ncbi:MULTISPECIES: tyrosine-type recombinase/integrase [unclassified Undibacterium]|uniref:tyrosine-type recombinase/integrase n=1 Tax=unclassified Undibacterium TaxID=2630295 RepID=UPI002AC94AFC|nr:MULTISPECIES: tyrosine-type recombinase/integrase [unclassified Undibacterium]MEB0139482.1 tyrosine-type recombinase/integrase [Undibacterium sp. CCC2.1]MEB0172409.1 tyrosine-type recombinase/integrase [Undibacterium sp. CCC1.1]MEB0175736.1 tyrosine-type recombinase/integrase [Undibacterium sp. CCC3.4]MEB0214524.1 tyrosine-type recombinase/integrase [Undibacterium sp. 5I2]WPX42919.1 tyrosine-type recombinase/integrase [Undibacterium sp. CCC3.4]
MKQRFFDFDNSHETESLPTEQMAPNAGPKVPSRVRIRTRYHEDEIFVETSGDIWQHSRYCSIKWRKCQFDGPLLAVFRHFIWYRLSSCSPKTAESDFINVVSIQDFINKYSFPWSLSAAKEILTLCTSNRSAFFSFRLFYRWSALKGIPGFSSEIASSLDDLASPYFDPYLSVKSRSQVLTPTEEILLLRAIDELGTDDDYFSFQDNVISHLSWELGCRPEQIAGIEHGHYSETVGPNGSTYYDLKIIRLKQGNYSSSYRKRVISERVALKIKKLILLKEAYWQKTSQPETPLFLTMAGRRIKTDTVRLAIAGTFEYAVAKSGTSTLLRHNMAQKLADQGTPGDLISDLLDHTTKIAARHYVAATPEIGRIKTRALGKNETYKELMGLMTGTPINSKDVKDGHAVVKGVVATRYIGNIGACGLDTDTHCDKNPIYSCYSCRKFHPFINGDHDEVVSAVMV